MESSELKAWRDERHLSLDDMAHRVGVSRRTLSRWEKGELPVPHEIWKQLNGPGLGQTGANETVENMGTFNLPIRETDANNGHELGNEENAQSQQELTPDIEIIPYSAPPPPERPLPLFGNGHALPSPLIDDPPPALEPLPDTGPITPEFLQLTLLEARIQRLERELKRLKTPAPVANTDYMTRTEVMELVDRVVYRFKEKGRAETSADLQMELQPIRRALGLPSTIKTAIARESTT